MRVFKASEISKDVCQNTSTPRMRVETMAEQQETSVLTAADGSRTQKEDSPSCNFRVSSPAVCRRCSDGARNRLHRHPDGAAGRGTGAKTSTPAMGRETHLGGLGEFCPGLAVCQLTLSRTDGSWQGEVLSALAGSVTRTGGRANSDGGGAGQIWLSRR
jgi:hypothetical protein